MPFRQARSFRQLPIQEILMRKTILLAIIACILGIVLLSSLAFYIPNRLRSSRPAGRPEAFTGFEIMSERDTDRAGSEGNTSRELPNDTLPEEKLQHVIVLGICFFTFLLFYLFTLLQLRNHRLVASCGLVHTTAYLCIEGQEDVDARTELDKA